MAVTDSTDSVRFDVAITEMLCQRDLFISW